MSVISSQTSEKSATCDLMYQTTAVMRTSEKTIWSAWRDRLLGFGGAGGPPSSTGAGSGPVVSVRGLTVAPPRSPEELRDIPASVDRSGGPGNHACGAGDNPPAVRSRRRGRRLHAGQRVTGGAGVGRDVSEAGDNPPALRSRRRGRRLHAGAWVTGGAGVGAGASTQGSGSLAARGSGRRLHAGVGHWRLAGSVDVCCAGDNPPALRSRRRGRRLHAGQRVTGGAGVGAGAPCRGVGHWRRVGRARVAGDSAWARSVRRGRRQGAGGGGGELWEDCGPDSPRGARRRRGPRLTTHRRVASIVVGLVVVVAAACGSDEEPEAAPSALNDDAVTVASFNFPESQVLAEIYSQALEAGGYTVRRALSLGPREFVEPALAGGLVELVPEYAGTALQFLSTGEASPFPDAETTLDALRQVASGRGVTALASAPAQDSNTIVVTRATAEHFGLRSISDLQPIASQLTFGGPPECPTRPLCLQGLESTYGLFFKEFIPLDAGGPLTRQALRGDHVDGRPHVHHRPGHRRRRPGRAAGRPPPPAGRERHPLAPDRGHRALRGRGGAAARRRLGPADDAGPAGAERPAPGRDADGRGGSGLAGPGGSLDERPRAGGHRAGARAGRRARRSRSTSRPRRCRSPSPRRPPSGPVAGAGRRAHRRPCRGASAPAASSGWPAWSSCWCG